VWFRVTKRLGSAFIAFAFFAPYSAYPQSGNPPGSASNGSPYRVVRSIAGAEGHEINNKFFMDDARSLFNAGKDSKVIVYFEWEGPLGQHHFEGLWKSPEGKIVLISDFRYEAKTTHYSGYWTMLLSEGTPSGEWNLEARIDGEPAGTLSFVVTGSPVAHTPAPPQPLPLADLYRRATDATVIIEKLTADGALIGKSSGFWIADDQILTAFESIDGASSLRLTFSSGAQTKTDQVALWNRWQDWAVLKVVGNSKSSLKRSSNAAVNVGDRCSFLEWGTVGSKLADGSITGTNSFPRAGARLIVASGVSPQSIGGALLDEFGNYVGIIGGSVVPSANPITILDLLSDPGANSGTQDWQNTGLAVPITLLPEVPSNATPTSLAELFTRGEFAPPLIKSNSIQYMTVTSAVTKDPGSIPFPQNSRQVFSKHEKKAAVYVNWQTSAKEKVSYTLCLFSADNKLISSSKPQGMSLAPGKFASTTWQLPLELLPPGIYRVDLVLNDKTAWRDFIRITD
jgi:hypothetical protein